MPLARAARRAPELGGATALARSAIGSGEAGTPETAEIARFVIGHAAGVWPIGTLAPLLVVGGLVGLVVLARRSRALAVAVAGLAAVTLAAVILGAPGRPYGIDRYLVPWRLAVSIGLASLALLPGRWTRAGVTAAAVLACLAGAWAAAPRGLPGPFAVGDLARSLAPGIDAGEAVAFVHPYQYPLGSWYGLPMEPVGTRFPRRPDGSLPPRVWLFAASFRNEAPEAPGMGADRGRYRPPEDALDHLLAVLLAVLESAYGAHVDREALDRALRAHGAAAIDFVPGAAALHVPSR